METTTTQSLYEKLGSRSGITKIVDDIVEAHMVNPTIKARFIPYNDDPENLKKIKGHLVDFICAGTGGEETYQGRPMDATHRGMNITDEEYMAAVDDIMSVLRNHGVSEDAQKDMLFIAYTLREEILGQ